MATVQLAGEVRFVIDEVSWEAYEALLKSWENRSKRMTYDRGRLEFMSPLLPHEGYSRLLCEMVCTFTAELDIPRQNGGSLTLKQQSMECGLEPDECFWIQNESRVNSLGEFDPEVDPPPDLAIEVDITSSSLNRMSIYASLGVPEVWRFDGETFTINLLRGTQYESTEQGLALPALTVVVLTRFLGMGRHMKDWQVMKEFREWIRTEIKDTTSRKRRPRKK